MKSHELSFRQVHLDFHTSEHIDGIGARFDRGLWQKTLQEARVSSITAFSCCHHGWSYHPTQVNQQHPGLKFDLLRKQMDAAHEVGVRVPVYLTAGVHNVAARAHPEWQAVGADGRLLGWTPEILAPGFRSLCFNTPYLDYLCAQIGEVMELFPDADGIFLDIVTQPPCCCQWCLRGMEAAGLNPEVEADRLAHADQVLEKYYQRTTETVTNHDANMPLFHNSGHLAKDRTERLKYFSHLELESLPTGGWGYDHFPLSAKYADGLGVPFLGMTGKFHHSWGEFGGFKHPNALRYECAAMLAFGARCSIGDQLHPSGEINPATYDLMGEAYREVESKEPWCVGTKNVADVALLSHESCHGNPPDGRDNPADTGATRLLLEGHLLFDVINASQPFDPYKALLLPDEIAISPALQSKLESYLAAGGQLILSGESGLRADAPGFLFSAGAEHSGASPFAPDFIRPAPEVAPAFLDQPMVVYGRSQRIRVTTGTSLGQIHDPYFNRTHAHFCSHRHSPNRPEPSGFDAGVRSDSILYFAHPIFSIYYRVGAVALKDFVLHAIRNFLGDHLSFSSNLPSTARVTLREQPAENRTILHLLYGPAVKRGAGAPPGADHSESESMAVEVIEDLPSLVDREVQLRLDRKIERVTAEPEGNSVPFTQEDDTLCLPVDRFSCHQMLVLHDRK